MMGVKGLREAFNAVVQPAGFVCTLALLDYDRKHDTEFQILRFRGTAADGAAFEVHSDDLTPGTDMAEACRLTAEKFLNQAGPQPAAAAAEPSVDQQLATMSETDLTTLRQKIDDQIKTRAEAAAVTAPSPPETPPS